MTKPQTASNRKILFINFFPLIHHFSLCTKKRVEATFHTTPPSHVHITNCILKHFFIMFHIIASEKMSGSTSWLILCEITILLYYLIIDRNKNLFIFLCMKIEQFGNQIALIRRWIFSSLFSNGILLNERQTRKNFFTNYLIYVFWRTEMM